MCLLQADREANFVVLSSDCFNEKAAIALAKNFAPVQTSLAKTKTAAVNRRNLLELDRLAKNISRSKCLSLFFIAKAYKYGMPFRSIVSKQGYWQSHPS